MIVNNLKDKLYTSSFVALPLYICSINKSINEEINFDLTDKIFNFAKTHKHENPRVLKQN